MYILNFSFLDAYSSDRGEADVPEQMQHLLVPECHAHADWYVMQPPVHQLDYIVERPTCVNGQERDVLTSCPSAGVLG